MTTNGDLTAAACIPSHRNVRRRKNKGGVDSISSLPDEILQHILCFIPTKFSVRTSFLSRRWRYVWCDTPSISFESSTLLAASIMEAQNRYTAPKMMSLHLRTGMKENVKHINTWIELAMSRHVENMSLEIQFKSHNYEFPEFFFINSSVKELRVALLFNSKSTLIPKCSVSWTSLKKLSFRSCRLSDNSIAMILSGCPILEFLKLDVCEDLQVLDLSNSPRLRTVQVFGPFFLDPSPMKIVAPHVRCLKLINSQFPFTLVDLSSLAEANLNICLHALPSINPDSLGVMVVKMAEMLEKFHNVEKLTFGRAFLQILSRPELRSVAFPMFKVQALTLETPLSQHANVIPRAIEELLQNSPDLKKLTVHTRCHNIRPGLWKKARWEAELNLLATGIEHLLKKTKALEKMVVQVDDRYFKEIGFEEMVQTLYHNYNNVSIVHVLSQAGDNRGVLNDHRSLVFQSC